MAGTVTMTRRGNFRGLAAEVFRDLSYLSDSADGSVPNQDIGGLDDCVLTEYTWIPDATTPPAANDFKIRIEEKVSGNLVYLSAAITASAFARKMANELTGNYAKIDGPITVKLVSAADDTSACDLDNEKLAMLQLRFEKK